MVNANTATTFGKGSFGEIDLTEAVSIMRELASKVNDGDLTSLEDTLTVQAKTLDVMFNELARRAALNMGEHLGACETYLRMALKAQTQCRATIETLAEVKYPKVVTFVRQQNVAYQQQVNNDCKVTEHTRNNTGPHAHGKSANQSNELLEAQHGKRLDTTTTVKAGGNDTHMKTLD